jgi:phosphate transport system ATP-binding protein
MVNSKPESQISLQKPSVTEHLGGPKMVAKNIDAYFGKTHALRNVSLSVPEKRVTAIIGPSGCGKSTFLRCLNRMHEVAHGTMKGEIELDGHSVMEYDPVLLRRRV